MAAHSRLLYRDELIGALTKTGHRPVPVPTDAELIRLAYLAWGADCSTRLEGDFAFVLWDESHERGFASVDFAAGRTLYYASAGPVAVVAGSPRLLSRMKGVDSSLNVTYIGEVAAGLWAGSDETSVSGVRRLLPGQALELDRNGAMRLRKHGRLPKSQRSPRLDFEDAAIELRERLIEAVGEWLSRESRVAVWLSGGWDSTAVFAAGKEWLRRSNDDPGRLTAVSVSYPPDDPGYEDDLIQAVTNRWGCTPRWIQADSIPVATDLGDAVHTRDDPWCHPFYHWLDALAVGAEIDGASAVMTGNGGDQLFASPIAPLSDLFWTGCWASLRREWIERRGRGIGSFLKLAVLPGLPRGFYEMAGELRGGRRPSHYLDRTIPPWIRPGFVTSARLLDRQWDQRPWARPGHAMDAETEFFFSTAYSARVFETINRVIAGRGMVHASPLLDPRVVELATRRPGTERSRGLETKRLLRRSMTGLLPDRVLAPRKDKTGLTTGYFDRSLRGTLSAVLDEIGGTMLLGELGVVNVPDFRTHAQGYLNAVGGVPHGVALFQTAHTELWLRKNA